MTAIHEYIQSLDKELAAGNTTEHTHRPALKSLFQSLNPAITLLTLNASNLRFLI